MESLRAVFGELENLEKQANATAFRQWRSWLRGAVENLFAGLQNEGSLQAELRCLFPWLKDKGVTAVITAERCEGALTRQELEEYVSDCVILLDHRVTDQVSTRRLRVVKYRGTTHTTN